MNVGLLPIVILPMTFIFVLLIILVAKAPKAGAWLVGGLVLLAPVFLLRLAHACPIRGPGSLPLLVMPIPFLFVLLIVLLAKAPKAGAAVVVAVLVVVLVVGFFVAIPVSHRRVEYAPPGEEISQEISQWGEVRTKQRVQRIQVWEEGPPPSPTLPQSPDPRFEFPAVGEDRSRSSGRSPMWSQGVEQEFEADVYPSKLAAVRVAGAQLAKSIRGLVRDPNSMPHVVIFQEDQDYGLVARLRDAVVQDLPGVSCAVEAERRNTAPREMAVTLRFADLDMRPAPWAESGETSVTSGRMDVDVAGAAGTSHIPIRFAEKPWVEDFSTFANMRPKRHFSVGSSSTACLSESEAREQALYDAANQLQRLIGKEWKWKALGLADLTISPRDVRDGGFIVDTFVQGLYGSAGRIWRNAILIEPTPEKLARLDAVKVHQSRRVRETWARMGFSVIGVLVLIGAIYFFLNMATRGYYEWSLRIAGVVLAIVAIVSILMLVQ